MKKLKLTVFLLFVWGMLYAQIRDEANNGISHKVTHQEGDFYIGTGFLHYNSSPNYSSGKAFLLNGRVFVSKRFSFDGDIVFGREYMHMGVGVIGLAFAFAGNILGDSVSDWGLPAILLLLAAEHFAYHIPVSKNFEIAPHVGVLRYIKTKNYATPEHETLRMNGFVAGVEFNCYLDRFLLSPFAEYSHSYENRFQSFQLGLYLGYNWFSK